MNKKVFLSWFFALALFVLPLGGCGAAEEEILPDFESPRKISSTFFHAALIDGNGHLWTWGDNFWGQIGDGAYGFNDGSERWRAAPYCVSEETKFVTVATDLSRTFAIDEDGMLWGCGILAVDDLTGFRSNLTPVLKDIRFCSISTFNYDALAIDTDGNLWGWFSTSFPLLTQGTLPKEPTILLKGRKFVKVSVGSYFYYALDDKGSLWSWGKNPHGQLGNGSTDSSEWDMQFKPQRVFQEKQFTDVLAVRQNAYAIDTDGHLWACGENTDGQLGDGTKKDSNVFVRVATDRTFKRIGGDSIAATATAIASDGSLWTFGYRGIMSDWEGYEDRTDMWKRETTPIQILDGLKFSQLSEFGDLAIATNGDVYSLWRSEAWRDESGEPVYMGPYPAVIFSATK